MEIHHEPDYDMFMKYEHLSHYLALMGIEQWQLKSRLPNSAVFESKKQIVSSHVDKLSVNVTQHEKIHHEAESSTMNWENLRQCVANCTACDLYKTRTQTVFGVGNKNADLLIVGEAPGEQEDKKGEPFVGRAGQLLDNMLQAIHLKREQVYIANILKCRPPNNRDPHANEVEQCTPFLEQQVKLLKPKLILALGRHAAHYLLSTKSSLNQLRGKEFSFRDTGVALLVTYHPAYLLRSPLDKRKALTDLIYARQLIDKLCQK